MSAVQLDHVSKPSCFSEQTIDLVIKVGKIALVATVSLALIAAAAVGVYFALPLMAVGTVWFVLAGLTSICASVGVGIAGIVAPLIADREIYMKTDANIDDCLQYLKTVAITAGLGAAIGATAGLILTPITFCCAYCSSNPEGALCMFECIDCLLFFCCA